MKQILVPTLLAFSLTLLSCKNGNSTAQTPAVSSMNPETESPNTDIKPAFQGQTRIKGVKTTTPYEATVLTEKLGRPWAIIDFPGNRFLVTDKTGGMLLVSQDGKTITKISGLPSVDTASQGGLLDVVLDPEFARNRTIYWSYSEPYEGGNHTAVAKGVFSSDETKIEQVNVIFRATPTYNGRLHYGSRLAFDKEGHLFVSTGERSDRQTRPLAQDPSTYLGKIIKITKTGAPAPGNPSIEGWKPEIYSIGHRNPQGLVFHPETGDLWEAEFGARGGDEINLIKPGKDYGWPTITYGLEYSGQTIGDGIGQKEGLEQPIYYWDPVISPSGIDFYTGEIEEWKNNLMIASLSSQKIVRLVIENNKVTGEEWLLTEQKERFRDVLSSSDGHLYAVTDSGKLYRVSKN